jgi:hypothetical protein
MWNLDLKKKDMNVKGGLLVWGDMQSGRKTEEGDGKVSMIKLYYRPELKWIKETPVIVKIQIKR